MLKEKGYRPVVEVDLDLTSLLAVEKSANTLKELASQAPGLAEQLSELMPSTRSLLVTALQTLWQAPAASEACLPGYTDGAIEGYGLYLAVLLPHPLGITLDLAAEERMAEWIRNTVHAKLRNGYWDRDLTRDEISPGFVDFLAEINRRGGEAVFVSNRPPDTMEISIARLSSVVAEAGVRTACDAASIPLFAYFGPGGSAFDGPSKQVAQNHLEQNPPAGVYVARVSAGVLSYGSVAGAGGTVVVAAVFDDRAENRRVIIAGAEKSAELLRKTGGLEIVSVAMATLWHTTEFSVTDSPFVTASFERKPPAR